MDGKVPAYITMTTLNCRDMKSLTSKGIYGYLLLVTRNFFDSLFFTFFRMRYRYYTQDIHIGSIS
jgi:hypothetical protein